MTSRTGHPTRRRRTVSPALADIVIVACVLLACPVYCLARAPKRSGPWCGISCLYTLAKLEGKDAEFAQLMQSKYVGSREGSTLAELALAAKDTGLYAVPVGNLTRSCLADSPYRIILHVKAKPSSKSFDHYVVFLGTSGSQALVFDPPNPVRPTSWADLKARWDGTGLAVSTRPIDEGRLFRPARLRVALGAAAVLVVAAGMAALARSSGRRPGFRLAGSPAAQAGMQLALAAVVGIGFQRFTADGLLTDPAAIASVQLPHLPSLLPTVTAPEVSDLMRRGAVVIDARYPDLYKEGHIPGAVNVPVDTPLSDGEAAALLGPIKPDARIVIYCQSRGCPFSEQVAADLAAEGYRDLSIFKGGWEEWTRYRTSN